MSDRIPLVDGPCAGQSISLVVAARFATGSFLFKAEDGSRHAYRLVDSQLVHIGPHDGPWICDSRNGDYDCYEIIQPGENEHPGDHRSCSGKTWPKNKEE